MNRVFVYGSLNIDLILEVERLPEAGETVAGSRLHRQPGGKGGNQAHAAVRLSLPETAVSMVGCVGTDEFGDVLRSELAAQGVQVEHVTKVDTATGTALITVDSDGANTIVVTAGANGQWPSELAHAAHHAVGDIVVCQLEVPHDVVDVVLTRASQAGARTVLNAAPYHPGTRSLLDRVDLLVVNEIEARELLGLTDGTPEAVVAARKGMRGDLVVTLGSRGALLATRDGAFEHVPAFEVDTLDTVGAGDAFVGGLAAALASGAPLRAAVRTASAAGALTATVRGARHPGLSPHATATLLRGA